jgi:TPP-dependent pyruvate/acetoin dehydrogenase alpha subunit
MYRDEDIEKIKDNINKIIDDSHNEYKKSYEPTMIEVSKVYNAIKDYIIRTKKIAYGGFAQNTLLMNKNKSDSFYKIIDGVFYNFPDVADIEFYSPNPVKDMVELLEELYKQGFKHIEGKNGVHDGTYKIFVNFINYCDIAYMPEYIYNNLPTIITDNNIYCTHPHFMVCDAYRIMTDPMTSYWRLEKAITRFNKLLNYYPITNEHTATKSLELEKPNNKIAVTYLGDGAINQGQVYESFNMAKLWNLPVIYVVENNEYAMGTAVKRSSSEVQLYKRGASFGIDGVQVDGMDVRSVAAAAARAAEHCRAGLGPYLLEMQTYRYRGHSMSDPAKYRTREEVQKMREQRDCIDTLRKILLDGGVGEAALKAIDDDVKAIVQDSADFAQSSPEPDPAELWTDVLLEGAK